MAIQIINGDCRDVMKRLEASSVHTIVTSPPYFGLRDYGVDGQIGLEPTPDAYVAEMVAVFREVRRVLRDDGTLWLNLGDSYSTDAKWGGSTGGKHVAALHGDGGGGRNKTKSGLPDKNLLGIPWRVAFALQADGWYLRQDIIWAKPNPMPESVTDRCTKAHEYLFLLSKSPRYRFDADAVAEAAMQPVGEAALTGQHKADAGGFTTNGHGNSTLGSNAGRSTRNRRSVWTVATQPFSEAHFATFPPALIEPCILAGCPEGGTVLDPFGGAGTTGMVADRLGRHSVLIELNPAYIEIARRRIAADAGMFANVNVAAAAAAAI